MPPALVQQILQKAEEEELKAQQLVEVEKQIDLTYDLRHLAAFDQNPIDVEEFRSNKEAYLSELARDNTQLVVNQIWSTLETKRVDNVVVAVLPRTANYLLPRAKPIPKEKPPTKWEAYAKEKGIQKKKKEKLVWDDVARDWKPRYGFHGINQKKEQWMIEVPDNKDPNVDYFEKQAEEKKERSAKNEVQRLRNIARSSKMRLPGTAGLVPNAEVPKSDIDKAKHIAKHATASLGKFTERLPDETEPKNLGKKRKFESNTAADMSEERSKNLKLIDQVLASQKKPIDDSAEESALRSAKKRVRAAKRRGGDEAGEEDIGDRFDKKNRAGAGGGKKKSGKPPKGGPKGGKSSPAVKKSFKKGPQVGAKRGGGGGKRR